MPVTFVFIHGWGFDAGFWDPLCARLPQYPQQRIDLGFFGAPSEKTEDESFSPRVLVGHSLGFVHGIKQGQDWSGWIAINGFSRFVKTPTREGCVTEANLREMRMRLQNNPAKTLQDFYRTTGTAPCARAPNPDRLRKGLDELRDIDVSDVLAALDVPGLALAGADDPLVPLTASEALGRMAKRGGLMLKDKAGHLLPQTDPAWCAKTIADFINANFG